MDGVDMERLMTVADVAALLSVGESTIRAWVRVGSIPCLRVNGWLLRFNRRAIEDWLREPSYRRQARSGKSVANG
jgi:excisionase family DNA binding protein